MLGVGTPGDATPTAVGGSVATQPAGQMIDERDAWAILAGVHGVGPVAFGALLRRYGSVTAILDESSASGGVDRLAETPGDPGNGDRRRVVITTSVASAIALAAEKAAVTLQRIRSLGLSIVTMDDPSYPVRLGQIEMPPHLLYVLGDERVLSVRSAIAIVGTRRPTDRGRAIAARLATNLVAIGSSVVSGLAVGIDGAAHAATVRADGTTIAVIGAGHARLHPRAHDRLANQIVASGGAIVSELGPDIEPSRGSFPRRNRIISGLADATVVIEAPARSGALITASWALEQGRECFLVPGGIDDVASAGCLAFLREFPDRARIVAGIPQLIADLGLADGLAEPGVPTDVAATLSGVGAVAGRLGREIVQGRATVDELVAATSWPVATVLAALTMLERAGLVVGVHGRFRAVGALASADPALASQRPREVA